MSQYFSFQWHITDECDQRCKHCYIFFRRWLQKIKEHDMERDAGSCGKLRRLLQSVP